MSGKQLVPALRFANFNEVWTSKRLDAVFDLKYGKDHKDLKDGCIPVLGSGGVMRYVDTYLYDKPSVLIGRKGTIDNPFFIERPFWTVDTLFYTAIKKEYLPYFVYLLAQNIRWKKYNEATGVPSLNSSGINSILACIPTIKEQQKIADFLSSVDEKISQLKERYALLQQYKKGAMQQIFTQQIRFKDDKGKVFTDWKEKPLSSLLTLTLREIDKPEANYMAIGARSHMKGTFQKLDFDPETIAMEKMYVVRHNDLIVNITFAWEGAIAIVKKEDDGGLVSHRFPTYTFKKGQAIHEYFRHIISFKRFKYMLDVISPGGAGRNRVLSKKDFLALRWNMPCVEEQKKIATFLDTLDIKINLVAQQIEQTQQFKKGLLQQMFV